jgi:hypothetical protein
MRIYRSKVLYLSNLLGEETPSYPQDYHEPEEIAQRGEGEEALDNAFHDCHRTGSGMNVGDVLALNSGQLFRCEASGWTEIGKTWEARVQQGQGRAK